MLFDCPCCGGKGTIDEMCQGMFIRCSVCGWEDDGVQQFHPDMIGSNGKWTLRAARAAWKAGETIHEKYPNPNAAK